MKIRKPEPNLTLDSSGGSVKILFCTLNIIRSKKDGYVSGRPRRLQAETRIP